MTGFSISSDRRPTDAQEKALAATVELRAEREKINLEIERLANRARALSYRITAVEREVYKAHMNSTARS
jgi:chaperonin cofactor prefoldin